MNTLLSSKKLMRILSDAFPLQVGALIGKGGSVIKNIRQTSGAMVKISSVGESSDVSFELGANNVPMFAAHRHYTVEYCPDFKLLS